VVLKMLTRFNLVLAAIAVIAIVLVLVVVFGIGTVSVASFINIALFTAVLVAIAYAGRAILRHR
jgi:hypothetical protein